MLLTRHIISVILAAVVLGAWPANAAAEYGESIARARHALAKGDTPAVLYHIKAAHFADRGRQEPFELLRRIPAFNDYQRSAGHYAGMAAGYYRRGDYRNARFFYAAAYFTDPGREGLWEILDHVDAVMDGRQPPLSADRLTVLGRQNARVEAAAVRVSAHRAERISGRHYTVEHPPEINAILVKYTAQPDERQRKIEEARHDVLRRQGRLPHALRARMLKQQAAIAEGLSGRPR